MDMSEVKAFNAELSGLYDNKPPISKAKMSAITKGSIKAIKFYKHVVHSVEKFIQKCKPEYKVPGLYVIDSIVRQSRHQFGQEKDVFAPRFAKNMQQTFANLFRCPPEDKCKIIRVLNLWQKNNVFSVDVIQPLLDMADPNHPLHQEIQQQQNNTANGSTLNFSHNTSDNKMSPAPAQHTPHISTPMGDQFQDQSSSSGVKFNRKLLNDFEYESEDDTSHHEPTPHPIQAPTTAEALGSILTNPEIMRQLQSLQAQMQMMTGMQIPNLMPMMSDMQLQQNQNPFMGLQQQDVNKNEGKDELGNNESDIEFVETGPQVIEIPDANDSRSPSPRSRRHRSRSPRRRRRSRSRSPRRRRDRDRDKERERDKDRDKSYKEREAEREKQKEREKKGLPPIKKDNLSVCSTTLWVGHLSKLATAEELSDLFAGVGGVCSIDVVAPRGCAFVVMERRRDAHKALHKLNKHKLHTKEITVAWAPGKGVKGREWKDYWETELGVSYLPWEALQARWSCGQLSLLALEDGGQVDEETLPPWLPPRMLPKLDNMMQMGAAMHSPGMPGPAMPGPPLPGAAMPGMPGPGLGPMPSGLPPQLMAPMMARPHMPPPGMTAGMPPLPGMPPGLRPPNMPAGLPGLGGEAGSLLGFPPSLPPQSMPQPAPGLLAPMFPLAVRGLPLLPRPLLPRPAAPQRPIEVAGGDDAMDLDTSDSHEDHAPETIPVPSLSDQLQALLSKPPPNFNSLEPPPNFNPSEPPPFPQPPPAEDKQEEEKKDRDRDRKDRDRRDGRDRDRDRRDRGDRSDRGDRDREKDRHRDRGGRDRGRDDRDDRRDRDRGRDRRDRDRDRDRERFPARDSNNSEKSRERSPRNPNAEQNEKSLQERLWEMANGKKPEEKPKEDVQENKEERMERPPRIDRPRSESNGEGEGGMEQPPPEEWNQQPRLPPPGFRPPDMRMRGFPRQPLRGPWMDGPPGPGMGPFGPRFNGMGPPPFNRPPFERPPFDGPMFDGPPRFERPPFNRMPFDGPRPPFDGSRPPFDGPRPPFDGPRPPFDGSRPPFDGPRPPFDGPRPPFDGPRPPFDGPRPPFNGPRPPFDGSRPPFDGSRPPFDGPRPPFDGPRPPFDGSRPPFDGFDGDRQFEGRFDGPPPPEFFDNRRFDDQDQYNDRGWNGDREWDRRNEWDDRRRNRSRDDERFQNRNDRNERNDRRNNYDDRRSRDDRNPREERNRDGRSQSMDQTNEEPKEDNKKINKHDKANTTKEERASRRDKDRKSRWGAAEQSQNEPELTQEQIDSIISEHSDANSNIKQNEDSLSQVDNVQKEDVNDLQESQVQDSKENIVESEMKIAELRQEPEYNEPSQRNEQEGQDDREIPDRHNDYEMNLDNVETDSYRQESTVDKQDIETSIFEREDNKTDYEERQINDDKESTPMIERNEDYNEVSYEAGESKKADDFDLPSKDEVPSLYDAGDAIDASFAPVHEAETSKTTQNVPIETMDTSHNDDIFTPEETPSNIENKEGAA